MAVNNRLDTRSNVIAEGGGDFEDLIDEAAREEDYADQKDVQLDVSPQTLVALAKGAVPGDEENPEPGAKDKPVPSSPSKRALDIETDGERSWVTINGAHVFIDDATGMATKGPASVVEHVNAQNTITGKAKAAIKGSTAKAKKGKIEEPNGETGPSEKEASSPPGNAGGKIESAARFTGRGAETSPGHDASLAEREARVGSEQRRLKEWAVAHGMLKGNLPGEDARGSEHIVEFDAARGLATKGPASVVEHVNAQNTITGKAKAAIKGSTPKAKKGKIEEANGETGPSEKEASSPPGDARGKIESAARFTGRGAETSPGHDASLAEREARVGAEQRRLKEWAAAHGKLKGKSPRRGCPRGGCASVAREITQI